MPYLAEVKIIFAASCCTYKIQKISIAVLVHYGSNSNNTAITLSLCYYDFKQQSKAKLYGPSILPMALHHSHCRQDLQET